MKPEDRIVVALDVDTPTKAISLVGDLAPHVGCFKIGLEFITAMLVSLIASGSAEAKETLRVIRELFRLLDRNVLWDGKFDDIPNTVGGASAQIARMRLKMFNVHASAGPEAIAKAVANKGEALVLGVTVLTSIDGGMCRSIFGKDPGEKVLQFAEWLVDAGADGVICAPKELLVLRKRSRFDDLLMVTPNIRPEWAQKKDDQDKSRQMTPAQAVRAGADYLVIGRPIRQPPEEIGSPVEAAKRIAEEIANVS